MKILHVITDLYTGGAENALLNLHTGGLAKQFDTQVFSLREDTPISDKLRDIGVPVHSAGMLNGASALFALKQLKNKVLAFQPDLIQGWMYHGNIAAWVASLMAVNNPVMLWNVRQCLYDIQKEKLLTRQVIHANRMLSSKPKTIVYNSQLASEQHKDFGFSDDRVTIIPNGFDLNRYSASSNQGDSVREALGIPSNAPVVGHLARFHPMKDHAGFLRSAVRVADTHLDAHFILGGSGVVMENMEISAIVPNEMQSRFHFLGERADVPDLFAAMDVFCLSSLWGEAFPNVLGEAMSSGLPCVATNVGECVNIVGDTGVIVPPSDSYSLEKAIEHMLNMTISDRQVMGAAARERIRANYEIRNIVEMYSDLYQRQAESAR